MFSTGSTSTSKSKLYDFLKGFEGAGYTGSSKTEMLKSFNELYQNNCRCLLEGKLLDSLLAHSAEFGKCMDGFLTGFYKHMSIYQKDPLLIKRFADTCKEDFTKLESLISIIVSGNSKPLTDLGYAVIQDDRISVIMDLCEKCPYYLNQKKGFCLFYGYVDTDDLEGLQTKFSNKEFYFLAKIVIRMSCFAMTEGDLDVNALITLTPIFNNVLAFGQAFQMMNPTGPAREAQIQDTISLLQGDPLDRNDPQYKYYRSVLFSVFEDIKEGKKAYIQDMKTALDSNHDLIHSKWDEEKDGYYSLKATSQQNLTHYKNSLVSSLFEYDSCQALIPEQTKAFDEYIGYTSPYPPLPDNLRDRLHQTKTILINNPGKFKGRIIHITDNATQDRCSYLHNRTSPILNTLRCDATRNQDIIRNFTRNLTLRWFLEEDPNQKIGIYGFDFSNATDTFDQGFQYDVLNFIFGPEIANFWEALSSLDKYIETSEGLKVYHQRRGQPQGYLASFNNFALGHHFIFLMDMKLLGFEDVLSEQFYRILGDDSSATSVLPEVDYFDGSLLDEESIPRSEIEKVHLDICKNFAGFIINYSKSTSTHYNSSEAKAEVAKVTYRNGQFFSPIPVRLAMNYNQNDNSRLAIPIWLMERGCTEWAKKLMDIELSRLDPIYEAIVKCGVLPFLKGFQAPGFDHPSWMSRMRYAASLTILTAGLSFMSLSDTERDKIGFGDSVDEAIGLMFGGLKKIPWQKLDRSNSSGKLWKVFEKNERIIRYLKEIYESPDDLLLAALISPFGDFSADFIDELYELGETSKILRKAKNNPSIDISTVFPDFRFGKWRRTLEKFSNQFLTRGISKRPREYVFLLQSTRDVMNDLNSILGPVDLTWLTPRE